MVLALVHSILIVIIDVSKFNSLIIENSAIKNQKYKRAKLVESRFQKGSMPQSWDYNGFVVVVASGFPEMSRTIIYESHRVGKDEGSLR